MKKKNYLYFSILGMVALAGALYLLAPESLVDEGAGSGSSGEAAAGKNVYDSTHSQKAPAGESMEKAADASLDSFARREPSPLPPSLEGTAVDGGVRANADGELVVEPQVRLMFEYFLSTLGSASLDEVKVWVARYLRENLPDKAAHQGWQLFGRYLDYRRSLEGLEQPGSDAGLDRIRSVMDRRNALRREKLGREAAQAFFAAEQAYDRYMLERRRIENNDELSAGEKRRRLEQARAQLPEPMREVRRETTLPVRAQDHVEQMRAEGASEAEVRAWREANLGAEAADRLEKLEQRRQEWDRRYQAYRDELRQLDTSGLAEPERKAALRRLRETHFDEDEIRRVEALDRLRSEQAGERPEG